jgi:hypothetical protein
VRSLGPFKSLPAHMYGPLNVLQLIARTTPFKHPLPPWDFSTPDPIYTTTLMETTRQRTYAVEQGYLLCWRVRLF